jgi:SAM-dependent methyltransferase
VAECEPDTAFEPGIEHAVRLAPYDRIVDATLRLVRAPAERAALAEAGFRWMAAQPLTEVLAPHLERLARAAQSPAPAAVPTRLRLGGFSAPAEGWLGADEHNPAADLALGPDAPLPLGGTFDTLRFGRVTLSPERFDEIDAGDWPARVPDLEAFLRDCARLLRFGGRLQVRVPHDLAADAWTRPGTRRVFSERALGGYGDAHVTLGWGDCALELKDLRYELSEFGATLKAQGAGADNLVRTPRAVDRVVAILERRGYRALPGA